MAGKIVLLFAILAATLTSFCCSSRRIYTPTVKELPSSQQGSFGITKINVYATVGDTVELHCYGTRDFIYKLLWFKGGRKIGNYGRISFCNTSNDDYHESKITIKNITKDWSGEYVCKVTSIPGGTAENKVYLHVKGVCLVEAESSRRTDAVGGPDDDGSYDYGLFQINDRYWCNSGLTPGKGCNVRCKDLLSDDITKAAECTKIVYREQGFHAWLGWTKECKHKPLSDLSIC